ncbi:MAG: hypothetical protein WC022_03105 [Parcubacteria group bacterium]
MKLKELIQLLLNITTLITIVVAIIIVARIAKRKGELTEATGVSGRTYLILVGVVEVCYTAGLLLILSAMGVNVLQHLQNLEFGKLVAAVDSVDLSNLKFAGTLGWVGLGINSTTSFLAPGYLLVRGGKKLPRFIYISAWTEVGLEMIVISLVFISLKFG